MSLIDEIVKRIDETKYAQTSESDVISVRLSKNAAKRFKELGGSKWLRCLLTVNGLPDADTLQQYMPSEKKKAGRAASSAGIPKITISSGEMPMLVYSKLPIAATAPTVGWLEKLLSYTDLRTIIRNHAVMASPNIIACAKSDGYLSFIDHNEGDMFQPWIYLGKNRYIRVSHLYYLMARGLLDELQSDVFIFDDPFVPSAVMMPTYADVSKMPIYRDRLTTEVEAMTFFNLDHEKFHYSYWNDEMDNRDWMSSTEFFIGEGRCEFHGWQVLCTDSAIKYAARQREQRSVSTMTHVTPLGLKGVHYRGSCSKNPWLIQVSGKSGKSEYRGSYPSLNEAIMAMMEFKFIHNMESAANEIADQFTYVEGESTIVNWWEDFRSHQRQIYEDIMHNDYYDKWQKDSKEFIDEVDKLRIAYDKEYRESDLEKYKVFVDSWINQSAISVSKAELNKTNGE